MAMTLSIPDDVVAAIKWPRQQLDQQLAVEMAFALYARDFVSMGTARRLAKLDKWAFLEGLAERQIERHYGEDELEEDIHYANICSELVSNPRTGTDRIRHSLRRNGGGLIRRMN